jgi:hypothetical protein
MVVAPCNPLKVGKALFVNYCYSKLFVAKFRAVAKNRLQGRSFDARYPYPNLNKIQLYSTIGFD